MSEPYGKAGPPDPARGGSGRSSWPAPEEIVPCEARPSRLVMVVALVGVVIIVGALLTQRDTSGGFLVALFSVGAVALFLIAVRALVARIRLDAHEIIHVDLFGKRRISLEQMDRPVVVEPRRRSSSGEQATRGYELIIRQRGGRGPWLLATAAFWDRRDLERMAGALGAHPSPAATRAAVEERFPGATTWLLRRTQTQWSIALGVALVVGLMVWQTR